MARFLIEVPHEAERVACARVIEIFLKTGSHFLTHADWDARTASTKPGSSRTWRAARRPAPSCLPRCARRPSSCSLITSAWRKSKRSSTNINVDCAGERRRINSLRGQLSWTIARRYDDRTILRSRQHPLTLEPCSANLPMEPAPGNQPPVWARTV